MGRRENFSVGIVAKVGISKKVGQITVRVLETDQYGKVLSCSGTSIPWGSGYAKGCIFLLQNATAGLSTVFVNKGSDTAAAFRPMAAGPNVVEMFEDFPLAASGTLPVPWGKQDTSVAGAPVTDYVADAAGGQYELQLAADNEVEAITLYHADQRVFDITKGPVMEARVKIRRDVTGATGYTAATDKIVIGLASDRNAALDDIAVNAWFLLTGATNNNLYVETDDGATDNDDNDLAVDQTENTWMILTVDCSTLSNIRFLKDGVDVTPEAMTLAAATGNVQPFIEVAKAAAANRDHELIVDWIHIYCTR